MVITMLAEKEVVLLNISLLIEHSFSLKVKFRLYFQS